ncbi:MAG: energy transducer TonB [Bacteroidales bacterium]|jgi:protein TonB|nr:energy transducer TonB [Bacteroidales bacterium]
MEKRKTEKADLENKKGLFLQIGLVFTLAIVLIAFEWKSYDAKDISDIGRTAAADEEDIIATFVEPPPPPPPPPPPMEIPTDLTIVDDSKEIENEIEISAEISTNEIVEAYVAPDIVAEVVQDEEEIFIIVEENAGFPGGDEARMKYLRDNIRYPPLAREAGIQGTVHLTFVVERDGRITDVRVVRGIGGGADEEAIRVVQNMPRWSPGKQRGKAVRVQFNLPIRFTLTG